ncbi:MAG: branched-chain amino acid transport system II carrier protein [Clostridiales Family XIII bacterium]|nr:branched-chain amino acid transport system II carrier protein [Clostridiales Family XIII bacterium]
MPEITNNKLPLATTLTFGIATFAMYFGGSCMLWPVTWGQQSGSSVPIAMIGIFVTGLVLPYIAYYALVRGGSFWEMASRLNPKFALVFCGLTAAVMGPLFSVPRMSSAAWDAICQVFGITDPSIVAVIIFQIVYYVITYLFVFQGAKVLDRLGKLLTPFLLVTVAAVVIKGLMSPLSEWTPKLYPENALQYGLLSGYQTTDLPASLLFGGVIIMGMKAKGLTGKQLGKPLMIVAAIGFAILSTTHMTQMLLGASTGRMFEDVTYARLYATIILAVWGQVGGVVFNIALSFAALTTAVGLVSGCSEFMVEATGGKVPYRQCAIVIIAISAVVASAGLNSIVVFAAPILSLIYPPCIAMVLGYIITGKKNRGIVSGVTVMAFAAGAVDCILGYADLAGAKLGFLHAIHDAIPLASFGFAWILPAILGGIVGYFIIDRKKTASELAV